MKTDIKLVETNKGLFEYVGELTYYEENSKHVDVDGERFFKHNREQVTKTIDQIYKETEGWRFQDYEFDFNELDVHFKIRDYNGFMNGLSSFVLNYSSNNYVNNLVFAQRSKLLDKRITDVFTSQRHNPNEWWEILHYSSVNFFLEEYGWNNAIYYSISLETLFSLDYKQLPKVLMNLFRDNGINLKSKNKVEEATDMLKQIAKYKLKEKQRWNQ